jgi:hypothetical protein
MPFPIAEPLGVFRVLGVLTHQGVHAVVTRGPPRFPGFATSVDVDRIVVKGIAEGLGPRVTVLSADGHDADPLEAQEGLLFR